MTSFPFCSLSNMSYICASSLFSKILDLLHYHYSEFLFNAGILPISTSLSCSGVLSCSFFWDILLCCLISFNFLCLQSLSHRLQDCISFCFLCLLPVGEADLRVFCRLPGGMDSCLPTGGWSWVMSL